MEGVAAPDSTAVYQPVVTLAKVAVDTGEQDETEIFKERAHLYRFNPEDKEWKERGRGDCKLLKHKESGQIRVILRQQKTLKVRMNHAVHPELELKANAGSDRSWTWTTTDFAELEPSVETFAIRFKDSDVAQQFLVAYDAARASNKALAGGEAKSDDPDASPESAWQTILSGRQVEGLDEAAIKAIWDAYDADKSGFIDAAELQNVLKGLLEAILKHLQVPVTDEVSAALTASLPDLAAETLKSLDSNGDGKVSWAEFLNLEEVKLGVQ